MSPDDLREWLDGYVEAFAACARGERDPASVLGYYAPPVLLSTDDVCVSLAGEDEVLGWARGQFDAMRSANFARIEIGDVSVSSLNDTSALVHGAFVRRRTDDAEIARVSASYLVTTRSEGARIAALLVHTPTA